MRDGEYYLKRRISPSYKQYSGLYIIKNMYLIELKSNRKYT